MILVKQQKIMNILITFAIANIYGQTATFLVVKNESWGKKG
jgi:hypothetical protein